MSHKKASTDNGKELHLYSRIGMYNEKILSFFNADGSDYDFTNVTVQIGVKKNRGDDDFVTLDEGDGITITDNDVHFVFTEAQSALFRERPYYWQFRRTIDSKEKVWLNGDHDWHNGKYNDNTTEDTLTINDNGDVIQITINDANINALNTRVRSTASTATLTPNVSLYDMDVITAQAAAIDIANPTGTPSNGNAYVIRIKDDATARAITFGNKYRAIGSALPTTTTISKTLYFAFVYDSAEDKYDVFPSQLEQ